jgi:hypothetical protein
MNPWPDLRPFLRGIDWVLIGGVATRAYMPERATRDMDILVHLHRQEGTRNFTWQLTECLLTLCSRRTAG